MRPPRKTLTATTVAGRYQLDRELARGGMGTVWVAVDKKLGRNVAIKVMAQELAQLSEALQRFEREAMAVAGLRSTHVVEVYDYGVQEGLPYIVMELLEGESLGQRLKREQRLTLGDTNLIVGQICKGLKAAHAAKLIHRDLKPSNIFLTHQDDIEVVKLLDFGVVKQLSPTGTTDETVTGILLGTPQYMSPEQARATREIDHRSDLWSVAVVAFRALTGVNPFRGESVGDIVLKICSDALPRVADHQTGLPPFFDDFFCRAFERDANQRFQNADELAMAFEANVQRALGAAYVPPRASIAPSGPPPSPAVAIGPATAPLSQTTPLAGSFEGALTAQLPAAPSVQPMTFESTPVSTTVGGTQLAPGHSTFPAAMSRQTVTLVVGAAATMLTFALVFAVWVGSDETAPETSSPSQAPATSGEGAPQSVAPTPTNEPSAQAEITPSEPSASAASSATAPTVPTVPKRPHPPAARPAPKPAKTRPDPPPPSKPRGSRPDWGLGDGDG